MNSEIIKEKNYMNSEGSFSSEIKKDEIDFFDLVIILLKFKWMIISVCSIVFFATCGITLLMPNIYTSTTRILPPQDKKTGLASMLGGMGDFASIAGLSVGNSASELYVGLLRSITVADKIIDEFDLMAVYGTEFRVMARKSLEDHVKISLNNEEGIISVSVDDFDPNRATAIANRYVDELKKFNIRLNLNTVGKERLFLESRLAMVEKDLIEAEEKIKDFQEKNKTISISEQGSAIIEAIAKLKEEIARKEVELGILLSYQTDQNVEVKALRETVLQLKLQIKKLEEKSGGKSDDIFLRTSDMPELGVQYTRLIRNFKIQEEMFELLIKQYELAKINEARDASTIEIIDIAKVPDKKSKPKRSLIVILTTIIASMFAIFSAFVRNYFEFLKEKNLDKWKLFRSYLMVKKR